MAISEREISGKRKVSKSTLTGQHEAELKQGKDGWDVANWRRQSSHKGRYETCRGCIEPTLMVH
jgi:hypothetical protein